MRKLLVSAAVVAGLSACTAQQPEDPEARAIRVHEAALVLDAHADIELREAPSRYAGPDGVSQVAPEKMRAGGVDAVVMSAAVGPKPRSAEGFAESRAIADREIDEIVAIAAESDGGIVVPTRADDLVSAHAEGKLALVLGMQNALILGQSIEGIGEMYNRGVRVFALTHMGHNDFADSSRPLFDAATNSHEAAEEHGGLSELGVAAVKRVNGLGGVMDISQLSKNAALQVIELSSAPVIASHSNVRALSDVSRNLSDEEIDRIGETGGVIHVAPFRGYLFDSTDAELVADIRAARRKAGVKEDYLYPFELYWEIHDPEAQAAFLGEVSALLGPGSVEAMLNHVDYIAKRIGVDHVGIGTDFNHGSGVLGFRDASEALSVTRGLLARGYSEDDVKKIWGGNFIRVWREAESRATR